ncbi:MAG: tetratricopeptide repeat protein [Candidatus Aminicenantales bacterium]
MKKNLILIFLALIYLALFFISCASSPVDDQIKLGLWASEKGLWNEAIFRWKKALALNPNSVVAHNNLAVAYETKGLFKEALQEYERALELSPENSHVKMNYQNCKENLNPAKKESNEEK